VGSNPTLSAIFLVPAKLQYYRRLATHRRLSCSAAQLRRISTPHLPSIEFA
jgi:hypothetical protein